MPSRSLCLVLLCGACVSPAAAQPASDLSRFFGFDPMRIVVVDDGCGPMVVGDFNNDGRPDLAIVNNRKSRIEVHLLRAAERNEAERERAVKSNELPPSPWYDRVDISVAHRVQAIRALDFDGDGKLDILFAGTNPNEIVALRQESPSKFTIAAKRELKGLQSRQAGFRVADVLGDPSPEIIAIADDRVCAMSLGSGGIIGEPVRIGTAASYAAAFVEDFNGDGMKDLLGVVPEDPTPLRLWQQRQDPRRAGKSGLLASELRFEMPALREVEPIRFPGRPAASLGVIERASKRVVFFDLVSREVESAADGGQERQVRAEVWAFADGSNKDRSVCVTDLDGDGRLDLLATNAKTNTVDFYRQADSVGLGSAESFSAFKKPKSITVGRWASSGKSPDVFVLSEEEKTVGASTFDASTGRLSFPAPIPTKTPGATPVAMEYVALDGAGHLAVVVKDKRDHTLELHKPTPRTDGSGVDDAVTALELKGVSRPPQSILACDADQDGRTDILLLTPGEPMIMVRAKDSGADGGYEILTDKQMAQFGLVQAAGPDNTAILDSDGDGKPELLIADDNFIRACRYDAGKGWRVVDQVTIQDNSAKLVGLTSYQADGRDVLVAADKGNGKIVFAGRSTADASKPGPWVVRSQLRLRGFPLSRVYAGAFAGDGKPSVLCVADDGFALVRLAGQRADLESFAAFRPEDDDRQEHEIEVGDLNGDGKIDLAVLDSGERMCEIFTFSASRKIFHATEFEVFQSRLFTRGQGREGEPRDAVVADATGDGLDDLLVTVHDRVIIYPQAKPGK